jgi:hypothetical protein
MFVYFKAHRVERAGPGGPDDCLFSYTTTTIRSEIRIAYTLASVPEMLPCRFSGNNAGRKLRLLTSLESCTIGDIGR